MKTFKNSTMWFPTTIEEYLDERIKANENWIEFMKKNGSIKNPLYNDQLSEFTKALVDFQYLKKELTEINDNYNKKGKLLVDREDKERRRILKKGLQEVLGKQISFIAEQNDGYITMEVKSRNILLLEALQNIYNSL